MEEIAEVLTETVDDDPCARLRGLIQLQRSLPTLISAEVRRLVDEEGVMQRDIAASVGWTKQEVSRRYKLARDMSFCDASPGLQAGVSRIFSPAAAAARHTAG